MRTPPVSTSHPPVTQWVPAFTPEERVEQLRNMKMGSTESVGQFLVRFTTVWQGAREGGTQDYEASVRLARGLPSGWRLWALTLAHLTSPADDKTCYPVGDFPAMAARVFTQWALHGSADPSLSALLGDPFAPPPTASPPPVTAPSSSQVLPQRRSRSDFEAGAATVPTEGPVTESLEGRDYTRVRLFPSGPVTREEEQPRAPRVRENARKRREDRVRLEDYGQPFALPSPLADEDPEEEAEADSDEDPEEEAEADDEADSDEDPEEDPDEACFCYSI